MNTPIPDLITVTTSNKQQILLLSSDPVTVTYHIKLAQAITTATDTPISPGPLTTTVATSLSAQSLMHMLYLFTHIFTSVK